MAANVNTKNQEETKLQTLFGAIDYRVARSKEELEKAYLLVYNEYLKRNYICQSSSTLRLSMHNALPATATFIAVLENEIFSTATVVADSKLGLPMDESYHEELSQLRKQNKKLCEVTMLASNTSLFTEGVSMMLNSKKMFLIFNLFKLIFDYAIQYLKLDCICISINPKHSLTYDFLLFKDLGGLKQYDKANGAPAIAKFLDLSTVESECKEKNKEGLYLMFFEKRTTEEKFADKCRFSESDLNYFFKEKTSVFKNASFDEFEYIKSLYPGYNL